MKTFLNLVLCAFIATSTFAKEEKVVASTNFGYGNSIIFTENNIEFAIYPDGQFDFHYQPAITNINIQTSNVNISFNSGYNYDPYIQYDDYGAIIQIENVPIYYDYYGRIVQAGNIMVNYNNYGRLVNVGGLYVYYDGYGHFSHFRGFINPYNRVYVVKPWHRFYRRPLQSHCIVYSRPYRAYYHPHRVSYNVYRNDYRPNTRRSFYRPNENITHYRRGERTTSRRTLAHTTTKRSVNARNKATTRRSSNRNEIRNSVNIRSNTREIVRTDKRKLSTINTVPTRKSVSTRNHENVSSNRTQSVNNQRASKSTNRSRTNPKVTNTRTYSSQDTSASRRR